MNLMNLVKRAKWLIGAAIAVALGFGFGAAVAWSQSTVTTTTTTITSTVNPDDPVQFPPAGPGTDSHGGKLTATFVDNMIALAKAQGQDTSAAETQQIMGQRDLRMGMNDEAAQHFDAALRSVGVSPNSPGEDSGYAESPWP